MYFVNNLTSYCFKSEGKEKDILCSPQLDSCWKSITLYHIIGETSIDIYHDSIKSCIFQLCCTEYLFENMFCLTIYYSKWKPFLPIKIIMALNVLDLKIWATHSNVLLQWIEQTSQFSSMAQILRIAEHIVKFGMVHSTWQSISVNTAS